MLLERLRSLVYGGDGDPRTVSVNRDTSGFVRRSEKAER